MDLDYYLVERFEGGWMVLEHETYEIVEADGSVRDRMESIFETVGVTVADIYDKAVRRKTQGAQEKGITYAQVQWPVDEMVAAYIAARYYDLSDPVQAAEQTLVGLGAPLTVMPAAARVRPT